MFLFFKKNIVAINLILILLVVLAYVTSITGIPDSIILFENEKVNIPTIAGIKLIEIEDSEEEAVQASTEVGDKLNKQETVSQSYRLSFLGFNLKTVKAEIVASRKVVPLGDVIGLKLYTQGVLVVGMNELTGEDNRVYKPYQEAGIEQGDSITKVNEEKVVNTKELLACISKSKGRRVALTYVRDGKEYETTITPVKTGKTKYQLGLWVRDAAAGVGTLSFYDMETNSIISLGHGIQDIDTGEMVTISSGEFVTSQISNVQKGEKNKPGRIEGSIENSKKVGTIYSNTAFGVYGYLESKKELKIDESKEVEVASRDQIKEEEASILCTLENGKKEEYKVKIQKVFRNNNENNKSMIIKVTDERLLNKTGGIIQGMSGSPILQNGKLIGALTHVLVSDPTTGYGVFADLMLAGAKSE